MLNFKLSKSFPNNFIIKPIGVTTQKNISPIINGEIILPSKIPNLNQNLFKGVKIFELINPKNKNASERIIDQILISPLFIKG